MPVRQRTIAPRYKKSTRSYQVGVQAKGYGLAFQANAKANYALSQLNTEKKYIDASGTANGSTGSVTFLNGLTNGTNSQQRVGQSVRFVNLSLRLAYAGHATEDIWYRYMLVHDKSPHGVSPAITTILNADSINSHRNLDYTSRFTVLCDKVLFLPAGSGAIDGGFTNVFIDLAKKAKANSKLKSKYESNYGLSNTGLIGDVSEGAFYLVQTSSSATNEPIFSWESRMRFLDN